MPPPPLGLLPSASQPFSQIFAEKHSTQDKLFLGALYMRHPVARIYPRTIGAKPHLLSLSLSPLVLEGPLQIRNIFLSPSPLSHSVHLHGLLWSMDWSWVSALIIYILTLLRSRGIQLWRKSLEDTPSALNVLKKRLFEYKRVTISTEMVDKDCTFG